MSETSILRQVVLVSYGTSFLQGRIALEDWHRHEILSDARFQFRSRADNTLLAEDFTWWLGILKLSGSVRLSLHLAADFQLQVPHVWRGSDYAIVVHYANHHDLWAVGEEHALWLDHSLITEQARCSSPVFPDAAIYSNDMESYWQIDSRQGAFDVVDTDWKKLAASIAADLGIAIPSSLVPPGPLILPMGSSPAPLPLFPFTQEAAKAHHVAATLYREQSSLSNDMNPKNENTFNQRMDCDVHQWGERLDSWMTEVLLRCANDIPGASRVGTTFQARAYTTVAMPHQAPETAQSMALPVH